MTENEIKRSESFSGEKSKTKTLKHAGQSEIKYDLVGKIAGAGKTLINWDLSDCFKY